MLVKAKINRRNINVANSGEKKMTNADSLICK